MNSVEKAFLITGSFEGGAGYSNLSGNFDGMLMSFGIFQWNAGQGTLRPLLMKSLDYLGHEKAKALFGNDNLYVLKQKLLSETAFKAWLLNLNNSGKQIVDPWHDYFVALGKTPECQKAQREASVRYIQTAKRAMTSYGFKSERAFCLLFDIAIQNGSVTTRAHQQYISKVSAELTERQKLSILAEAVATTSNWVEDVRKRKQTIVKGTGTVHGRPYHLEREFGLSDSPVNYGPY